MYYSKIKAIHVKVTVNVILSGEKLKSFSLKSRKRQRCPLSQLLFNNSTRMPSQSNKAIERTKKGLK
jgi:uncharacterized OsmC-like protein